MEHGNSRANGRKGAEDFITRLLHFPIGRHLRSGESVLYQRTNPATLPFGVDLLSLYGARGSGHHPSLNAELNDMPSLLALRCPVPYSLPLCFFSRSSDQGNL
jgi:hypothetical protein